MRAAAGDRVARARAVDVGLADQPPRAGAGQALARVVALVLVVRAPAVVALVLGVRASGGDRAARARAVDVVLADQPPRAGAGQALAGWSYW